MQYLQGFAGIIYKNCSWE